METAAVLERLGGLFDLKHAEIGARVGKSREYVSNYLRLLNLVPDVAKLVNEGHILLGHAKVLAGVPLGDQLGWADQIIRHKLTVRGLEQRIAAARDKLVVRSEEHTSELQSLMRISYAVFCLKKKIHIIEHTINNTYDKQQK